MPRTIHLHPLSLFLGAGFALLALVAMAQAPAAKRPATAHDSGLLQVAHPRDWVVIEEGVPFTVPTGRLLVLTAVGSTHETTPSSSDRARLMFDGKPQLEGPIYFYGGQESGSVRGIPVGLRAGPGAVVVVDQALPGFQDARAWGYLVDA